MNKKIVIIFGCILIASLLAYSNAFAGGWESGDWTGPGTSYDPDSGGGSGSCPTNTGNPRDDCNGYSWIFYKYIGGSSNKNLAKGFKFPDPYQSEDKLPPIGEQCAEYGEGTGFWHYGRNARVRIDGITSNNPRIGNNWKTYGMRIRNYGYDDEKYQFQWGTIWQPVDNNFIHDYYGGTWGHYDTIAYGNTPPYAKANQLESYGGTDLRQSPNPDQILYRNGVPLYQAVRYGQYVDGSHNETIDVLSAYKKAFLAIYNGREYLPDSLPHVYAFCYGPEMGGKFDGDVSIKANGKSDEIVDVTTDSFTLTFDHYIKRNDITSQVTATNNYSINGDAGQKTGTERFNQNDQSMHNVWHVERSEPSPAAGSTKTYCTTLNYNSDFDNNGNGNGNTKASKCIVVRRKGGGSNSGSFTTSISCSATAAGESKGSGCNIEFNTNSRNWTITHSGYVHNNVGYDSSFRTNANDTNAMDVTGNSVPTYRNAARPSGYGVPGKCVRSKSPYTRWWWNYGEGFNDKGLTLYQTSDLDVPAPYSTGTNKHVVGQEYVPPTYTNDCKNGAGLPCAEGTAGCSCRQVEVSAGYWKDIYDWYYPGCEDGQTYLQNWKGDVANKTWNEYQAVGDDSLYLRDQESVRVYRCSTITANSDWPWQETTDSPTGGHRSSSDACSTITRWRRHIYFSGNTAQIKADTGIIIDEGSSTPREASTPRENHYVLDTTNSNGEFTVTFGYSVNRDKTEQYFDTGAEHYPVNNSWRSRETIKALDDGKQIYRQNGEYNVDHNYPDFYSDHAYVTAVSGWRYETVTGRLYYGQEVEVCGNLTFGDKVRETDDGSEIETWGTQEVGCVTIKREKQDCGNVVNSGSDGYEFSHSYGYNVARIGVQNSSISNDYFYTNWTPDQAHTTGPALTNTEIFARPGDTVRYKVDYCMGANYAHAVHEANGINDGGVDTTMHVEGNSSGKTNHADTTDRISADKRSNYLFGDTLGSYDGTKTAPIIYNFIERNGDGSINEAASIEDNNNIATKYSPELDENISKTYSCPIGGGNTSGTDQHYQIAGKVTNKNGDYSVIDGCSSNRTQSLDVGRTLSEKLIWTDMSFDNNVYHANVNGDYLSNAYIRVPYNYTAKPYLTTNNSPKGTVQIGGKLTTTPGIAVFPRKNCAFITNGVTIAKQDACQASNNPNATYATVTKPTTVKLEAYVNNDSRIFQTDSYVVRANTKSNRKGSTAGGDYSTASLMGGGTKLDSDYVVDVPNDVNPGDKICVKMTITPADSHNYPGNSMVFGASPQGTGTEETDPTKPARFYWALREDGTSFAVATSCSTAVKRPTISIEDSNLYSASNITTSVVSRNNYTSGGIRHANNGTKYYLFGSWSEYGIFGKVATGTDNGVNISTLGTASGASLGYSQTSYLNSHKTTVTGYNAQPLTVVTYNGGPKNGTYEYNYSRITRNSSQLRIVYEYETKEDGSRYYRLASKTNQTIAPSSYTFANSPIVNAANQKGVAEKATKICTHSTQTFANVDCDDGKIGSTKIGADAVDVFTTNILDRYGDAKMPYTKTDGAEVINGYTNLTETSAVAEQLDGDEGAAMFKNIKGKAFLGYKDGHAVDYDSLAVKNNGNVEGADTNLTAKSVMVYKADTVVISSSLIANNDEKTGSGDFRMPIIIANKVWFTGNPTRVDAIIIAKEELNTCKWNSYNDFLSNVLPSFPTKKNNLASNKANEMSSNICNNELRFTAPVVVKGKLILNRTYGAGGANGGGDQIRRAEIFELNAATYLWSFAEMSRYSQAITTYSRELPSRY